MARRTLPAFIAAVQRRAVEAGVAPEGNDASPQPAFRALVAAAFDPTAGRFISDAGSDSHQTDPRESHDDAGDDLPLDHLSAVGRSRPSSPADDQFGEGPREHLWIELDHIVGPTAHGRLVNDVDSSAELRAGCQVTVATDAISDWQVIGGGIVLTPDEADWLAEAVQAWLGSGLESGLGHKLGGGAGSGQ